VHMAVYHGLLAPGPQPPLPHKPGHEPAAQLTVLRCYSRSLCTLIDASSPPLLTAPQVPRRSVAGGAAPVAPEPGGSDGRTHKAQVGVRGVVCNALSCSYAG
jgi:hypothetical protein